MTEPELAAMLSEAEAEALTALAYARRALLAVSALRRVSSAYAIELCPSQVELSRSAASLAIAIRKMSPAVERGKREAERMAEKESAA